MYFKKQKKRFQARKNRLAGYKKSFQSNKMSFVPEKQNKLMNCAVFLQTTVKGKKSSEQRP